MFAKLYTGKAGKQILVKLDTYGEDAIPEIRYYFDPDCMGVCSISIGFHDGTKFSWESAEKIFNDIDENDALKTVTEAVEELGLIFCF